MTTLDWNKNLNVKGVIGEKLKVPVGWHGNDGTLNQTEIVAAIREDGKQRCLEVRINGVVVAIVTSA